MPPLRKLFKIFPLIIICCLVVCLFLQEHTLLNRTEVRQEIVYKFGVLEQNQNDNDFESSRSNAAMDKRLIDQLMLKSTKRNAVKNDTADKSRTWFQRQNRPHSTRPISEHPLFSGYIIENPDLCGDQPVHILIYLHSAVENVGRRKVIRETWASTKLFHDIPMKTVFVLGRASTDSDQLDVLSEYAAHGDIVQGQFPDAFRNLTRKAVTIMTWINWHCSQAKYIIKSDDDYFVDTFSIVEDFLPSLSTKTTTFQCRYSENFEIIRTPGKKWHIEPDVLKSRTHYPPFCSGFFLIFTGDVIPVLYDASFNVSEYVAVDDAYLFGLLTEKNPNITFINIHDKISLNTRPNPIMEIVSNVKFEFPVFEVELQETIQTLWEFRLKRLTEWGRAHSLYVRLFESPGKRTVIV